MCLKCLQAPVVLLVAFGMYMLLLLVYGAVTFRSCPGEAQALHAVRIAENSANRPTTWDQRGMCHSSSSHFCIFICKRTLPSSR
jgi:hypothetical protein